MNIITLIFLEIQMVPYFSWTMTDNSVSLHAGILVITMITNGI